MKLTPLKLTPREFLIVLFSGALAVVLVLVIGGLLTSREPATDGSFELVRPGTYIEPSGTTEPITVGGSTSGPSDGSSDGSSDGPDADSTVDVLGVDGLVDAEGRPADLEIFRGGPLVINLWYSSCAPCASELRAFASVHAIYGDRVAFVGIDPIDDAPTMTEFAAERGVDYDLWRDPERRFVSTLGVTAFPTTLFIDADGRLVGQSGVVDADRLTQLIEEYFGASDA